MQEKESPLRKIVFKTFQEDDEKAKKEQAIENDDIEYLSKHIKEKDFIQKYLDSMKYKLPSGIALTIKNKSKNKEMNFVFDPDFSGLNQKVYQKFKRNIINELDLIIINTKFLFKESTILENFLTLRLAYHYLLDRICLWQYHIKTLNDIEKIKLLRNLLYRLRLFYQKCYEEFMNIHKIKNAYISLRKSLNNIYDKNEWRKIIFIMKNILKHDILTEIENNIQNESQTKNKNNSQVESQTESENDSETESENDSENEGQNYQSPKKDFKKNKKKKMKPIDNIIKLNIENELNNTGVGLIFIKELDYLYTISLVSWNIFNITFGECFKLLESDFEGNHIKLECVMLKYFDRYILSHNFISKMFEQLLLIYMLFSKKELVYKLINIALAKVTLSDELEKLEQSIEKRIGKDEKYEEEKKIEECKNLDELMNYINSDNKTKKSKKKKKNKNVDEIEKLCKLYKEKNFGEDCNEDIYEGSVIPDNISVMSGISEADSIVRAFKTDLKNWKFTGEKLKANLSENFSFDFK